MIAEEHRLACALLLESAGVAGEFSVRRIPGGANNQVFRVDLPERALLLKSYFRHPNDPRDRLGAEFGFARFAWHNGIRSIPQPIACDRDRLLGLFEFVDGRRLAPAEVDADSVAQAIDFLRELNLHRGRPEAGALSEGSEAFFSTRDHVHCVDRRVARLLEIEPSTELDRAADAFVRDELAGAWDRVRGDVCRMAGDDPPIPVADRCLSPSDFGYHNALREAGGRLRFLDFEYAGWDDPAKVVCDFFCQPAVPVPMAHFDAFAEAAAALAPDPDRHLERFFALLPAYRVKWCCIMLNDFLPVGRDRRRFADDDAARESRKSEQLRKARAALSGLG
jgi:hypothetical protein